MNLDDSQNIFDNGIQYDNEHLSAIELRRLLLECGDQTCRNKIEEIIINYENQAFSLNEAIVRITSIFIEKF